MKRLEHKVALITGASKGIGATIAKKMASEGAKVIVNYHTDKVSAQNVVDEVKANGGDAIAIKADVSKATEVKNLFIKSKETFGSITTLVNNAGVYKFESIEAVSEEEFHNHFNTNVLSVFLSIQEAMPHFENKGGSIINISSVASVKATAMTSLYTATKSAVDGITKTLSKELGSKNIRINSILPGPTETEGNPINTDMKAYITANTPLGNVGKTTDISQLAVFLASEEASWITGQKISVSGGFE